MKTYKLKKDIFKKWYTLTEEQVMILWIKQEDLEEVKCIDWASNGMYVGEEKITQHYYIDVNFNIDDWEWYANKWLSFKTKEQAQDFADKLKALKTIWKRKTENDWDYIPDWDNSNEDKYYIYLDSLSDNLQCTYANTSKSQTFCPYYSSKNIIDRAKKELEKEYLILLKQ